VDCWRVMACVTRSDAARTACAAMASMPAKLLYIRDSARAAHNTRAASSAMSGKAKTTRRRGWPNGFGVGCTAAVNVCVVGVAVWVASRRCFPAATSVAEVCLGSGLAPAGDSMMPLPSHGLCSLSSLHRDARTGLVQFGLVLGSRHAEL